MNSTFIALNSSRITELIQTKIIISVYQITPQLFLFQGCCFFPKPGFSLVFFGNLSSPEVGTSLQHSALALLRPPDVTFERVTELLQDLAQLMGGDPMEELKGYPPWYPPPYVTFPPQQGHKAVVWSKALNKALFLRGGLKWHWEEIWTVFLFC